MTFLRMMFVVIYSEVLFRWYLLRNRKLIKVLERLSANDPKLCIRLRLSETKPRKVEYEMLYRD